MSTIDIVRDISAELAVNVKKQATGWRWAKGVVPFPDIRCPYCKEAVRSKAIWKHTETALIGAAQLVLGQSPTIGKVEHPHARQEWTGQKICFGSAKDAHQALFGALNPNYVEHTVPFLQSEVMGHHQCDAMPEPDEPYNGAVCFACEGEVDEDDAYFFNDDRYCPECFYERAFYCERCGDVWDNNEAWISPDGTSYCHDCFDTKYFKCYYCNETYSLDERLNDPDGDACCNNCWNDKFFECERCEDTHDNDDRADCDDEVICEECYDKDNAKAKAEAADYTEGILLAADDLIDTLIAADPENKLLARVKVHTYDRYIAAPPEEK